MSIDITLYWEEHPVSSRSWHTVPRVGESVEIAQVDAMKTARVAQVIWRYTCESSERAQVDVYLE